MCHPGFPWQLSDADKFAYACLRSAISTNTLKSPRNRRVLTFTETLEAIKSYVLRSDRDSGLRALLCGLCWLPEGIAINTHQLRLLIPKCKSSINGSLQKLGYSMILGRSDSAEAMRNFFPLLRDNQAELRKWSLRKRAAPAFASGDLEFTKPPEIEGKGKTFEIPLDGISRYRQPEEAGNVAVDCGFERDLFLETDRSWDTVSRLEPPFDFGASFNDPMGCDRFDLDEKLNCIQEGAIIDIEG
jgi:hypothetical protein